MRGLMLCVCLSCFVHLALIVFAPVKRLDSLFKRPSEDVAWQRKDRVVVDVVQPWNFQRSQDVKRLGYEDHVVEQETRIDTDQLSSSLGDQTRQVNGGANGGVNGRANGEDKPPRVLSAVPSLESSSPPPALRGPSSGVTSGLSASIPSPRSASSHTLPSASSPVVSHQGLPAQDRDAVEGAVGPQSMDQDQDFRTPYEGFLSQFGVPDAYSMAARKGSQAAWIDADEAASGHEVMLSTSKYQYMGYHAKLRRAIQNAWDYPQEAARRGISGQVKVRFVIKKDGYLKDLEVLSSSGYVVLDQEVVQAIKAIFPFDPLPAHFSDQNYEVLGRFSYRLRTRRF